MELVISLDARSPTPLHRQIYDEIRKSILTGRLTVGACVPSTRALAASLGVSRSTVTQSYDQLVSEGYLQTIIGSGTKVSEQLPDDLLQASPVGAAGANNDQDQFKSKNSSRLSLSKYGDCLDDVAPFEALEPPTPIHFKSGLPALDQFPMHIWRRLLLRRCRADPSKLLDYATFSQGEPELRAAIARYIARSRAVRCVPDQVIIVNGSQQAIDLATKIMIDRGDTAAIENPGYLGARRAFLAQGAELHPVSVDESGIVIDQLTSSPAGKIKMIYVTPSHQFPTGAVLCLHRRLELLAWATEAGAVIVEDDYDSEFRYSSRPIPSLQGLSENDNVIYVGTFSKILFPSLRVGYIVVPLSLARIFARARWVADRHTPTLEQHVLTDFINEGHLERHLRRMRTIYDRRRRTLARSLEQHFGDRATILGENAGIHLMIRLQTKFGDEEVVRRAKQAGVGLTSARIYYLCGARADEFVMGYANLSERKIQEGVRRLAKAVK